MKKIALISFLAAVGLSQATFAAFGDGSDWDMNESSQLSSVGSVLSSSGSSINATQVEVPNSKPVADPVVDSFGDGSDW